MTGWRLGFAGGPTALIKAMRKVQSQTLGSICSIAQAAAIAALDGPQDLLRERALSFQRRRDKVLDWIARIPGLSAESPQGAFYVWIDCSGLLGRRDPAGQVLSTDEEVMEFLLQYARVAVVPGAAYGLSPYFRVSIASSQEELDLAFQRIGEAIAGLTA